LICYHYHVISQCKLHSFIAIRKSSPVASWDSTVSIGCALQNLAEGSHPGIFHPTVLYTVKLEFFQLL